MDVSIVTGSRSTADNTTSVYTFALGIIAGGFLAIAFGEIDMEAGLRGDLLRIYLAVLTAVLAGLGAFLVSRIGDRISDRRARNRRIGNNLLLMRGLQEELEMLCRHLRRIIEANSDPAKAHSEGAMTAFIAIERIKQRAAQVPDFEDLIECEDDESRALRVIGIFHYFSTLEPHGPYTTSTLKEYADVFASFVTQQWIDAFEIHSQHLGKQVQWMQHSRIPTH